MAGTKVSDIDLPLRDHRRFGAGQRRGVADPRFATTALAIPITGRMPRLAVIDTAAVDADVAVWCWSGGQRRASPDDRRPEQSWWNQYRARDARARSDAAARRGRRRGEPPRVAHRCPMPPGAMATAQGPFEGRRIRSHRTWWPSRRARRVPLSQRCAVRRAAAAERRIDRWRLLPEPPGSRRASDRATFARLARPWANGPRPPRASNRQRRRRSMARARTRAARHRLDPADAAAASQPSQSAADQRSRRDGAAAGGSAPPPRPEKRPRRRLRPKRQPPRPSLQRELAGPPAPQKSGFENLEDEMASLLGRPKNPSGPRHSPRRVFFIFCPLIAAGSLADPGLAQDISINLGQGNGGVTDARSADRPAHGALDRAVDPDHDDVVHASSWCCRYCTPWAATRAAELGDHRAGDVLTAFVMGPVLQKSYDDGIKPLVSNQIGVRGQRCEERRYRCAASCRALLRD